MKNFSYYLTTYNPHGILYSSFFIFHYFLCCLRKSLYLCTYLITCIALIKLI